MREQIFAYLDELNRGPRVTVTANMIAVRFECSIEEAAHIMQEWMLTKMYPFVKSA